MTQQQLNQFETQLKQLCEQHNITIAEYKTQKVANTNVCYIKPTLSLTLDNKEQE